MLTITWSITCDHCGKNALHAVQDILPTDMPQFPPRFTVFGSDVCPSCLEKAKTAVGAALRPPQQPLVRIS